MVVNSGIGVSVLCAVYGELRLEAMRRVCESDGESDGDVRLPRLRLKLCWVG